MKRILIAIATLCVFAGALNAQELANFQRGGGRVVSPEIQNDSVTFRFRADYATYDRLSTSWTGPTAQAARWAARYAPKGRSTPSRPGF